MYLFSFLNGLAQKTGNISFYSRDFRVGGNGFRDEAMH